MSPGGHQDDVVIKLTADGAPAEAAYDSTVNKLSNKSKQSPIPLNFGPPARGRSVAEIRAEQSARTAAHAQRRAEQEAAQEAARKSAPIVRRLNFPQENPWKTLADVRAEMSAKTAAAEQRVPQDATASKPLNFPTQQKSLAQIRAEQSAATAKAAEASKKMAVQSNKSAGALTKLGKSATEVASHLPYLGFLGAATPVAAGVAATYAGISAQQAYQSYRSEVVAAANPNLAATAEGSRQLAKGAVGQRYTAEEREEAYFQQYRASIAKRYAAGEFGALRYFELGARSPFGGGAAKDYDEYKKKNPLLESYEGLPQAHYAGVEEYAENLQQAGVGQGPLEQKILQEQIAQMSQSITELSSSIQNLTARMPPEGFA